MEIFKLYGSILVEDKAAMSSLQKVDKEGSKLAGGFGKLGGLIAGAFSVAAIISFGKKVVEASANLQAMNAQFDQVFKGGENEKAVERITAQVGDLGIHADRLTASWNSFGGQVKGAGMESEQALTAVDKATRLAADGAAFYDTSLESSSASLASFMKGNFAAGDAIGVFTNAKQMDVKSNEMYGKSWADLTESERQWLLLDTVEKTYEMNGAMGQAAREANSYENVMGNLKATFQSLWAVIGEPVLEVFLVVVQGVTKWITDNMPAIEITIKKIFEGIKTVWNKVLEPVLKVLLDVFKNIVQWVQDNWPTVQNIFKKVFDAIASVWDNVLKPVLNLLLDVIKGIVQWVQDNWPTVQNIFKEVFEGIALVWGNVLKPVLDLMLELIQGVVKWVQDNWPIISSVIGVVFDAIALVWDMVLKPVLNFMLELITGVVDFIANNFPGMQKTVETVFDGIAKAVEIVTGVFEDVIDAIRTAWEWLTTWNETEVEDKETTVTTTYVTEYGNTHGGGGQSFGDGGNPPLLKASGDNNFIGGLAWVGEKGPELVDLPRGARIFSNERSKEIVGNGTTITQNITINSPKALSASEVAKETKKAAQRAVLPLLG